jgi:hypothetical protein
LEQVARQREAHQRLSLGRTQPDEVVEAVRSSGAEAGQLVHGTDRQERPIVSGDQSIFTDSRRRDHFEHGRERERTHDRTARAP